MGRSLRSTALAAGLVAFSFGQLAAQQDSGWRISPQHINIQVGQDRRLQALDDSSQELEGVVGLSAMQIFP
jgi:hypothetical protein